MPKSSGRAKTKAAPERRRALPGDWSELVELGFTQMEAGVYAYLLSHPPATGYAVAKALGKPAPYVYRAMESLLQQGAVLLDDSRTNLCRAVPFEELLDQLKRRFETRCTQAAKRMRRLTPPVEDDGIYRLTTVDQVFERCRAMLAAAKEVAYADLFPDPLAKLSPEIVAAARRKVKIALQVYEPTDLPVAWTVIFPQEGLIQGWPRQWIRLAVDGTEHLTALLTEDGRGVYHAVWTAGPVFSYMQARSMGFEILLLSLQSLLDSGASLDSVRTDSGRWQRLFRSRPLPGAERVARLFTRPTGS